MSYLRSNRRAWVSMLLTWARGFVFVLIIISVALVLLDIALITSSGSSNISVVVPNDSWTLEMSLSSLE